MLTCRQLKVLGIQWAPWAGENFDAGHFSLHAMSLDRADIRSISSRTSGVLEVLAHMVMIFALLDVY